MFTEIKFIINNKILIILKNEKMIINKLIKIIKRINNRYFKDL